MINALSYAGNETIGDGFMVLSSPLFLCFLAVFHLPSLIARLTNTREISSFRCEFGETDRCRQSRVSIGFAPELKAEYNPTTNLA